MSEGNKEVSSAETDEKKEESTVGYEITFNNGQLSIIGQNLTTIPDFKDASLVKQADFSYNTLT